MVEQLDIERLPDFAQSPCCCKISLARATVPRRVIVRNHETSCVLIERAREHIAQPHRQMNARTAGQNEVVPVSSITVEKHHMEALLIVSRQFEAIAQVTEDGTLPRNGSRAGSPAFLRHTIHRKFSIALDRCDTRHDPSNEQQIGKGEVRHWYEDFANRGTCQIFAFAGSERSFLQRE